MMAIAHLYQTGEGVARDYAKALGWYNKASDAGDPVAMNWIGAFYEHGLGMPHDYASAIVWYRKRRCRRLRGNE